MLKTVKTVGTKLIAPAILGGTVGGFVGYDYGRDLDTDLGSLAGLEMYPRSGHKTDSGNQSIGYKQVVHLPDSEITKKENGDDYHECNEVETGSTDIDFEFFIQLACASVATEGSLTASFKLFNENALLIPASAEISVEAPPTTVAAQSINILPAYYQPVVGDPLNCAVNFDINAGFPVAPSDIENDYSIVFEIVDDPGPAHLDIPDLSRSSVDCQGINSDTLQYYQCIKAGNTHQKDHITIENIFLCPGN